MRTDWSKEVYDMDKQLEPYFNEDSGGIRKDSPEEIKELYKKFCKKIEEETWK